MKNKIYTTAFMLASLTAMAFGGIAAAFAASRWFDSSEKEDNSIAVQSWVKATVTSKDAFAAAEELTVKFAVRQWAEDGNYKLILSKLDYICPFNTEALNPDYLWEYCMGDGWAPISGAVNLELIPKIDLRATTAYLKIRVKPDVFLTAGFRKYLDYNLELTAALVAF